MSHTVYNFVWNSIQIELFKNWTYDRHLEFSTKIVFIIWLMYCVNNINYSLCISVGLSKRWRCFPGLGDYFCIYSTRSPRSWGFAAADGRTRWRSFSGRFFYRRLASCQRPKTTCLSWPEREIEREYRHVRQTKAKDYLETFHRLIIYICCVRVN